MNSLKLEVHLAIDSSTWPHVRTSLENQPLTNNPSMNESPAIRNDQNKQKLAEKDSQKSFSIWPAKKCTWEEINAIKEDQITNHSQERVRP